ncbi:unnamed protein product [Parnassius apollo]|uniref:(apollo) hypothetical protein n=1 Tax=Parnassius apollo TaxID=110799 RepID=A0A8S3XCK1_PARAO|nr:unnamed protein product [Parnassius apollo]
MAAKDGLSFNVLASSQEIKKGLAARKFEKIPSSPNTVRSMVFQYERKFREELIAKLNKRKAERERFSVTLDEWTLNRNRRYMNVNIHAGSEVYNLGLIQATGSVTANASGTWLSSR